MSDKSFDLSVLKKLAEKPVWTVADHAWFVEALPVVIGEIELMREIVLQACELLDRKDAEEDIDFTALDAAITKWMGDEPE